jgi:drug/metabolite transporter (DMT)-like permease
MNKWSTIALARFACLYAGAIWGIFWIPVRAINDAEIHGLWSSAIWFAVPTALLFPLVVLRFKSIKAGGLSLQITAFLSGVALLCYTLAFLYTDVVRAMLLYYLTPVWSTLLAAAILREAITWQRVVAIIFAIIGMLVIFGLGLNFPIPRNIGDWLGILSGFVWAIAIVRIRKHEAHSAVDMTIGFFFWSMVTSFVLCFFLVSDQLPSIEKVFSVLPWLIPFIAIAVIPGAFASLWGPKYVSPGLAGLLMMTEIIFGSITAALFANEPFGGREIFGIILISAASLFEPVYDMIKTRMDRQRTVQ